MFDPDDRQAIKAALNDPDPNNPIANALADKLCELTQRYKDLAGKLGRLPTEMILVKPRTAFDDIACHLFLQQVADATGNALKVVWVDGHDA